mgnify:CR=1 FL=1
MYSQENLPNSAVKNPLFHSIDLVGYKADLSAFIGKELYLEFCDYGSEYWNFLTFDDIKAYHETVPTDGVLAVDIKPVLDETHAEEISLYNGDFSKGMDGWTQEGCRRTWHCSYHFTGTQSKAYGSFKRSS